MLNIYDEPIIKNYEAARLDKAYQTEYATPAKYITELYALAMGFTPDEIGLKFHRVRLKSTLEKLGL